MIDKTAEKAPNKTAKKVFILKKSVVITALAVVAAVILIISASFMLKIDKPQDSISIFYMTQENGAIVIKGDKRADDLISGKGVADIKYSAKNESAAVVMSDGASYSLYYTDGNAVKHITSSASDRYVISADGTAVAYCDSASELYIFSCDTAKSTRIDNNVDSFALSPTGSALLYTKTEENANTLYVYSGGNASLVGENYIPLGISDDTAMLYVLSSDNSLYMLNNNGDVAAKICSGVSADSFCFSADMKNVVFNDGEYTYISNEGKSRTRLVADIATPYSTGYFYTDSKGLSAVCENLCDVFYFSTDDRENYSLYYIDADLKSTYIAYNIKKYIVTGENSAIYLDSQGKIYDYKADSKILIQSGALDVFATSDGKNIYYTTSSAELFCIKKGESILVADGVAGIYMTSGDKLLFINNDGELYSVSGLNKAKKIDEGVHSCVCSASTVLYMKNYSAQTGSFELYAAKNSLNFKLIAENVSNII
ncbi:MAG: hypothetical protein IJZ35_05285 [Clostridia bacterium]|nr:hypothetical protein [Clostridia bacterium]